MNDEQAKNPFLIAGYEGSDYFCDRECETEKLIEAVNNGRNVTLLAARRIGKTGLIKHLFGKLRETGGWNVVYVDIYATQNLAEFTRKFAAAVIGSMDSSMEKALLAAAAFFKSFRPGITIDPLTGAPTYSFAIQPMQVEASLKECFDYLATRGRCVVAIDEFQQIASYPEKGTEALLRSFIQFLPDTRFIFAGSRHHLMTEMFVSANRPFYNSTQTVPLDRIDREAYLRFAQGHMSAAGLELQKDFFDGLYDMFDGITWFVQLVLNRLYARRTVTHEALLKVLDDILEEKSWEFGMLVKALPAGSVRLLKAIARDRRVKGVTGADFLSRHDLGGASSVHLSLNKLLEDELLYEDADGYVVYDRLFGMWLARMS